MNISTAALRALKKKYPHSAELLTAFAPLIQAQAGLQETLPPVLLPAPDAASFSAGASLSPAAHADVASFLDDAFMTTAPASLGKAMAKGFPAIKDDAKRLMAICKKTPEVVTELITLCLGNKLQKIRAFATEQNLNESSVMLFAMQLTRAWAQRLGNAATKLTLPEWQEGYCPICGSLPHGSYLTGTEGQRFLQCSLCGYEWRFSRTQCPVCPENRVEKQEMFFLEARPEERGEACATCNKYLLGIDFRKQERDVPLEALLLCLMPLDLLMQEKGFSPITART